MTQEMFDRLPALLTADQVKRVTGWNNHDLTEAVRARQIAVWTRPARVGHRSYRKYTKVSVAVVVGLKV